MKIASRKLRKGEKMIARNNRNKAKENGKGKVESDRKRYRGIKIKGIKIKPKRILAERWDISDLIIPKTREMRFS